MLPFRSVKNFYPRPPRGGRPPAVARGYPSAKISIHALREEGDVGGDPALGLFGISIHALREEGDLSPYGAAHEHQDFYPRPPRGGRLLKNGCAFVSMNISIHALREEGDRSSTTKAPTGTISIHALREEGDQWDANVDQLTRISIHALREEGDTRPGRWGSPRIYFYPRPPRGGRPRQPARSPSSCNFYPRPPRGGRLACKGGKPMKNQFLSTPSARRATERLDEGVGDVVISIHALREEGDTTSRNSKTA